MIIKLNMNPNGNFGYTECRKLIITKFDYTFERKRKRTFKSGSCTVSTARGIS